jgi:hypothetical protein
MEEDGDAGEGRERGEVGRKLALWGVAAAIVVLAAIVGVVSWKGHRKKQDESAVVAAVGESTLVLREVLAEKPPLDAVARLDVDLKRTKVSERTQLAEAAEDYVLGAREIARRRADADRLAPPTAAARAALHAHLAAGARRNDAWFRHAGDLKKRVEDAHFELNVSLKALDGLLDGMQESRKRLAPLMGEKQLIEPAALNAARERVQGELKRSAEELERARQIPIG